MSDNADPKRNQATEASDTSGEPVNPEGSQSLTAIDDWTDELLQPAEYSSATTSNPYLTPEVLALVKDDVAKRVDEDGEPAPSPADFGEHKPIPVDSICASVVLSDDKEIEGDFDDETEGMLEKVVKGVPLC